MTPFHPAPRKAMTPARRARIFESAGGVCHICGGKIMAGELWDADHVKPLGLGGSDDDDQIRPAHVHCHKSKSRAQASIMAKADRQRKACVPFAERRQTKHKIPQRKDAWPPAPRKIASRPFPKPETRR